uniref:Uncharacterized protein n=1 Tax=Lygus hesperus TaxID=30085 RepID=A0A146KQD4_LYGHE
MAAIPPLLMNSSNFLPTSSFYLPLFHLPYLTTSSQVSTTTVSTLLRDLLGFFPKFETILSILPTILPSLYSSLLRSLLHLSTFDSPRDFFFALEFGTVFHSSYHLLYSYSHPRCYSPSTANLAPQNLSPFDVLYSTLHPTPVYFPSISTVIRTTIATLSTFDSCTPTTASQTMYSTHPSIASFLPIPNFSSLVSTPSSLLREFLVLYSTCNLSTIQHILPPSHLHLHHHPLFASSASPNFVSHTVPPSLRTPRSIARCRTSLFVATLSTSCY